jgi:hypothetical protein
MKFRVEMITVSIFLLFHICRFIYSTWSLNFCPSLSLALSTRPPTQTHTSQFPQPSQTPPQNFTPPIFTGGRLPQRACDRVEGGRARTRHDQRVHVSAESGAVQTAQGGGLAGRRYFGHAEHGAQSAGAAAAPRPVFWQHVFYFPKFMFHCSHFVCWAVFLSARTLFSAVIVRISCFSSLMGGCSQLIIRSSTAFQSYCDFSSHVISFHGFKYDLRCYYHVNSAGQDSRSRSAVAQATGDAVQYRISGTLRRRLAI